MLYTIKSIPRRIGLYIRHMVYKMATRKRYKFITHYEKNNNQIYRFFHDDANEFVEDFLMNLGYDKYSHDDVDLLMFLQVPNITKADILELFEYSVLCMIWAVKTETDEIIINTYMIDKHDGDFSTSCPKPTYISEYFNVIGGLFLAGYIDFGCDWDDDYKRYDYPTNLSYYKEDKYQAWVYFRDNFFYKEAYHKGDEDDILIYEGKEYIRKDCPYETKIDEEGRKVTSFKGYNMMYSPTSWDTPRFWSRYNIWATTTPKGERYREILEQRIYYKYKDLEVEINNKGEILQWFGQINR